MIMRYDPEADVLDILVQQGQIHHAEENDSLILNYDEQDQLIEIELLGAGQLLEDLFTSLVRRKTRSPSEVKL